jgi:hypothetical protein
MVDAASHKYFTAYNTDPKCLPAHVKTRFFVNSPIGSGDLVSARSVINKRSLELFSFLRCVVTPDNVNVCSIHLYYFWPHRPSLQSRFAIVAKKLIDLFIELVILLRVSSIFKTSVDQLNLFACDSALSYYRLLDPVLLISSRVKSPHKFFIASKHNQAFLDVPDLVKLHALNKTRCVRVVESPVDPLQHDSLMLVQKLKHDLQSA